MVRLVLTALCLSASVCDLRAEGGTLTNAVDVATVLKDQRREVGDRFELADLALGCRITVTDICASI